MVAEAVRHFDRICDEMIDPGEVAASERPFTTALGRSCLRYRNLLREHGVVVYLHVQVWAERVTQQGGINCGAVSIRAAPDGG